MVLTSHLILSFQIFTDVHWKSSLPPTWFGRWRHQMASIRRRCKSATRERQNTRRRNKSQSRPAWTAEPRFGYRRTCGGDARGTKWPRRRRWKRAPPWPKAPWDTCILARRTNTRRSRRPQGNDSSWTSYWRKIRWSSLYWSNSNPFWRRRRYCPRNENGSK